VDPYKGSVNIRNGMSWNRYAYVESDPVSTIDPRGLGSISPGDSYCRGLGIGDPECNECPIGYTPNFGPAGGMPDCEPGGGPVPIPIPYPTAEEDTCIGGSVNLPAENSDKWKLIRRVFNENSAPALGRHGWNAETRAIDSGGPLITRETLFAESLAIASTVANRAKVTRVSIGYAATTQAAGIGYPLWSADSVRRWDLLKRSGSSTSNDCDNLADIVSAVDTVLNHGSQFNFLSWRGLYGNTGRTFQTGEVVINLTVFNLGMR